MSRLNNIKERWSKVTDGQWNAGWSGDPDEQTKDDAGPYSVIAVGRGYICQAEPHSGNTWDQVENNIDAIASSKTDIEYLLAKLENVELVLKGISSMCKGVGSESAVEIDFWKLDDVKKMADGMVKHLQED